MKRQQNYLDISPSLKPKIKKSLMPKKKASKKKECGGNR